MIVEHALLRVRSGESEAFEAALAEARPLMTVQPGFQSIAVRLSCDDPEIDLSLVEWDKIESHRHGFRQSAEYQQWRILLHHFYEPMPSVNYYGPSIFHD